MALDLVDLKKAEEIALKCLKGGIDVLEAGTPLIKVAGVDSIKKLKSISRGREVFADMKTVDTGYLEAELAFKNGADLTSVLAAAENETIKEVVKASNDYGGKTVVDFIGVKKIKERAEEIDRFNPDYLLIHLGVDVQKKREFPVQDLNVLSKISSASIAVAGGLNEEKIPRILDYPVNLVIVGGAITKSSNPEEMTRKLKSLLKR